MQAPDGASGRATLEGTIERVVFRSVDLRFGVVRVRPAGGGELVTVVGPAGGLAPGVPVKVSGQIERDPKFGDQIRADTIIPIEPVTANAVERYLGSGLVPGVGPEIARRLVARFGDKTIEILENEPKRLCEVEGIGVRRSALLHEAWQAARGEREVMLFLQGHGITPAAARRIFKHYGAQALALVKENPYRLAYDVAGIGFAKADEIARKLGIPPTSAFRTVAGVHHALSELRDDGHVFAPQPELRRAAAERLGVNDEALLDEAIAELERQRHAVVDKSVGRRTAGADAGPAVYLTPLYEAERIAASRLTDIARVKRPDLDLTRTLRAIDHYEERARIKLAREQRDAVARALSSPLLVITGGPGVGKTTIVRGAVEVLESLGVEVSLAAPTGRAAKRLSEATGRQARTLHRLLEWSPQGGGFLRGAGSPLPAQVVIVDEASMIDLPLFAHLADALGERARLILVGDIDQLPSVGPGAVLRDLIASGTADVVRLREIFRQSAESRLIVNAHRINRGEEPELDATSDFFFVEREDPEAALATIVEITAERIPRRFGLDPMADVQVLVPMHRGVIGAQNINAAIQARLNPHGAPLAPGGRAGRGLRVGDKVLQLRNDYDRDVWNGDLGRVASVDREAGQVTVTIDDRQVAYEPEHLDDLSLAYATTVHKSQGSEYPAVVLPLLTQHYMMLRRNLLYTAVTRARRLCVIVGSRRALRMALRTDDRDQRHSALAERLARP
jgi:exodeoxyribonuclease V alpha subunit